MDGAWVEIKDEEGALPSRRPSVGSFGRQVVIGFTSHCSLCWELRCTRLTRRS